MQTPEHQKSKRFGWFAYHSAYIDGAWDKVLDFTEIKSGISLLYILRILIKAPYSLPLVLLICISIIYSLICLNLINIRTLRRPKGIGLLLRILLKIFILLFTGFTNILSFLGRICL